MDLTLKQKSFYVQIRSFRPKIAPPPCQFQQFLNRAKYFHFQNFWDVSMRKGQQQPPDWPILLKSEHVLKMKSKIHKFGHGRVKGFWMAALNLVIRSFDSPPPSGPRLIRLMQGKRCKKHLFRWELMLNALQINKKKLHPIDLSIEQSTKL